MSDVRDFYADKAVAKALARHLADAGLEERFRKSVADLDSDECVIPVLGTQGAGKSSFLNAVLFGDIVLPVDADETTCIPTVVRYGENAEPKASVVLASGERRVVACTEEGLGEYVHQAKNPGNEKGVAHIEILFKDKLLKQGIALVDLPGVGSITAANQKTTLEYLKGCPAAIFMLRTVPPITNSESVFIQGALPLMGRVFWVQNQWTDESDDEVAEGLEHNFNVLGQIADRLHLPGGAIQRPTVVCVKRALDGKVKNDAKAVAVSGLGAFLDGVADFAKSWRADLAEGKKKQALESLAAARASAEREVAQLSGDAAKERAKLADEKKRVDERIEANAGLVREARDFLDAQRTEISRLIAAECQKCMEDIRNNVRTSISQGLVGGPQLEKAFDDHVKRGGETLFQNVQPAFLDLSANLARMLDGLEDCRFSLDAGNICVKGSKFSEKSKRHEFYRPIGSAVGGIAGAAIGSIIPGVGTLIGGLVGGLLGGLLGGSGGAGLRRIELERQKEQARSELFAATEKFCASARRSFEDALSGFCDETDRAIRNWMKDQKKMVEEHFAQASAALLKPAEEKVRLAEAAKSDIVFFDSWKKKLEGK